MLTMELLRTKKRTITIALALVMFVVVGNAMLSAVETMTEKAQLRSTPLGQRSLSAAQPQEQEEPKTKKEQKDASSDEFPYKLPSYAREWCGKPRYPPLDYHDCSDKSKLSTITMGGGLTNALKFLLLAVTKAFEENRCIYVNEGPWHMRHRHKKNEQMDSFINRYFEPIGLQKNDTFVKTMVGKGLTEDRGHWKLTWDNRHSRLAKGELYTIPSLGYKDLEGHLLKKYMMRRMWRLRPEVRNYTCTQLDRVHGLNEEYLSFSIRRGDKKAVEGREYTPLEMYIEAAEKAIPKHFGGNVPKIFVATDDCTVMPDMRKLRPEWTFVSECDRIANDQDQDKGFVIQDMLELTLEQSDAHFHKFFVELYAMAISKYYIGVAYTNGKLVVVNNFVLLYVFCMSCSHHCPLLRPCPLVAWWAFFMRPDRWSFELIDNNNVASHHVFDNW